MNSLLNGDVEEIVKDFDMIDVNRILKERVSEESTFPSQYSQLIHYVKETIAKAMKDLIRENKGKNTAEILKKLEHWLKEKVDYINDILEGKKLNDSKLNQMLKSAEIKPASEPYKIIIQIQDAAAHFVAEYRAWVR